MKKHSIFIITLLLLAGLAGCAGQEPDKTETEYPSAVSSTAETASASKVIDRSPAGTVSSSAETKLPEPAPTEQQKEKTKNRSCRKHQTRRSLPHLCRKAPPRRSLLRRKRRSLQNRRKPNLLRPLRQKNRSRASHRRKVHRLKNPRFLISIFKHG